MKPLSNQSIASASSALRHGLDVSGKATHELDLADSGRLLVLPYGGRVLGLFPGSGGGNFFWTNPLLNDSTRAAEVFQKAWHNTGGDRTWIAPELEVFFEDYPASKTHVEPAALDASEYAIKQTGKGLRLRKSMTLFLYRSRREVSLTLSKTLHATGNPLRGLPEFSKSLGLLEFAGYAQCTTLEFDSQPAELNIWNLIQLPHGGEFLVATYHQATPCVFFGHIPPGKMRTDEKLVRYKADYEGEHKMGICPEACSGRIGYLYRQGGCWSLVIRNFYVNPGGNYGDVPKQKDGGAGFAVELVNVNSCLGAFAELEYHSTASDPGEEVQGCRDVSQVWAFRGQKSAIERAARLLLGVNPGRWTQNHEN
jgi:hypothetical protein